MSDPDAITVRLLGAGDEALLADVAGGVFDRPVDPRWSATFLADPHHHLAVALAGGRVVGMASAVHYHHPDKPPELWISEIGVAPGFRRRGLGKKLLAALFARGRALGCAEAWVLTEEENTAARRLYRRAGGEEGPRPVYVTFALGADATA